MAGSRASSHWVIFIFLFHLGSPQHFDLILSYSRQLGFSKQLQMCIHLVTRAQKQESIFPDISFSRKVPGRTSIGSTGITCNFWTFHCEQDDGGGRGEGGHFDWPGSVTRGKRGTVINWNHVSRAGIPLRQWKAVIDVRRREAGKSTKQRKLEVSQTPTKSFSEWY